MNSRAKEQNSRILVCKLIYATFNTNSFFTSGSLRKHYF